MQTFKEKIKLIEKSFHEDLDMEIEYKGNIRVISSPLVWSSNVSEEYKICAYHISGHSSSGGGGERNFFIKHMKIIKLIQKSEKLNKNLKKLGLTAKTRVINDKGNKVTVTVLCDKKGNGLYTLLPADRGYALVDGDEIETACYLCGDGFYIIENTSIINPEGDYDYENDGGSSRYRFFDMYDVYLAVALERAR